MAQPRLVPAVGLVRACEPIRCLRGCVSLLVVSSPVFPLCTPGAQLFIQVTWEWHSLCHLALRCPLVLSRFWPILIHRCRASVKSFPLKRVGPVRTRLRISISRNLSMKVPLIGLALYVRIGHLSRKWASTTLTISSARPLQRRDGGRYVNHLVQLRQVWYNNSLPTSPPTLSKRSGCVVCW